MSFSSPLGTTTATATTIVLALTLGACDRPSASAPTSPTARTSAASPAPAASAAKNVGLVEFPVSCNPAASQRFLEGVATLHSFWFVEAKRIFDDVTTIDPGCAMGFWGVAMTYYHPIWTPPTKDDLKAGSAAVQKAQALGGKTPFERDCIAAIAAFYTDHESVKHSERQRRYANAMRDLYAKYPKDNEAATFYSLALLATADPLDKTYATQLEAGAIADKVYAAAPSHPGAAHYVIHSYDYGSLAARALPAARTYATTAPTVPHALHMPSHTFTQLGLWDESIKTNARAAAAAKAYAEKVKMVGPWFEELHAMDYMTYAHLQRADDEGAQKLRDRTLELRRHKPGTLGLAYPYNAIPARFALERRQWKDAAALEQPWPGAFPMALALTHFARGYAAARLGDVARASSEYENLHALHVTSADADDHTCGHPSNATTAIEIQRLALAGWVAQIKGNPAEALRSLRAAADLEDATDDGPITPGPLVPSRELLGELFLVQGKNAEALEAFEKIAASRPGRFGAVYGAARAANLAGQRDRAVAHYKRLLELAVPASTRPEVAEARKFVNPS